MQARVWYACTVCSYKNVQKDRVIIIILSLAIQILTCYISVDISSYPNLLSSIILQVYKIKIVNISAPETFSGQENEVSKNKEFIPEEDHVEGPKFPAERDMRSLDKVTYLVRYAKFE